MNKYKHWNNVMSNKRIGKQLYLAGEPIKKCKNILQKWGYTYMRRKHKIALKELQKCDTRASLVQDGLGYRIKEKHGDIVITRRI